MALSDIPTTWAMKKNNLFLKLRGRLTGVPFAILASIGRAMGTRVTLIAPSLLVLLKSGKGVLCRALTFVCGRGLSKEDLMEG